MTTIGARFERITSRNTHNATTGTKKRKDAIFDISMSKRFTDMSDGQSDYLRVRGGAGNPCVSLIDMQIPNNPSFGDFEIESYKLGLNSPFLYTETLEKPVVNTYVLQEPLGDNEGNGEMDDTNVIVYFSGLDSKPDKHYSTDFSTYPTHRLPEGAEENIVRTSGQITKQSNPFLSASDAVKYNESYWRKKANAGGMSSVGAGIINALTGGSHIPTSNAKQMRQGYGDSNGNIPLVKDGDVYRPALQRYGGAHWRIDDPHWDPATLFGNGLPKYYNSMSMSSAVAEDEKEQPVKTTDSIFTKIRNTPKVNSKLTSNYAYSQINYTTSALSGKALRMYTSIAYDSEGATMNITGEVLANNKSGLSDADLDVPDGTGGLSGGYDNEQNLDHFADLYERDLCTQGEVVSDLISTDAQPTMDFGLDQNRRQDIFVTSEVPTPVRWGWDKTPTESGLDTWGSGGSTADRIDTRDSGGDLTCKTELDIDLKLINLEPIYKDIDETVSANAKKARRCMAITFSENQPAETDSLAKFVKTQIGTGSATNFQYDFGGFMLTKNGVEGQGICLGKWHPSSAVADSIQSVTGSTKAINGHGKDELIPQSTAITTAIPSGQWLRFKLLTDPETADGSNNAVTAAEKVWFTGTICEPDTDEPIEEILSSQFEIINCNQTNTAHRPTSPNADGSGTPHAQNFNFTHFPKYMTIWVCNWPSQMHSSNGGEPAYNGLSTSAGFHTVSGGFDQTFTPPDRWNGDDGHMPPHNPGGNTPSPSIAVDFGPGKYDGSGDGLTDWNFKHRTLSTGYSQTQANLNDSFINAAPTKTQTGAPAGSTGMGRFGQWTGFAGGTGPKVYTTHKEEYQLNNRTVTNEILIDAINWKRVNTAKLNLSATDNNTDTVKTLFTLQNNKSPIKYDSGKLARTSTPHFISMGFKDRSEIDFTTDRTGMLLWNGFSQLDAFTTSKILDADISGCVPIYWPHEADSKADEGPVSIPHNLGDTGGLVLDTTRVHNTTDQTDFAGRFTEPFNTLAIAEVAKTTNTNSGSTFFSSFESTYPRLHVTRSNSETGTCQALDTPNTSAVRLKSGANANDDFYNELIITITGGTGVGQSRKITDYDSFDATHGNRTAIVADAWTTTPDTTSTYSIDVCPQAIQNFTQKGYTRLMEGSGQILSKYWAKRENMYVSARITRVVEVNANSVVLEFDDYSIFNTLSDEEFIAFLYMDEYVDSTGTTSWRAHRVDTATTAGDAGWCAPMTVVKKDDRQITFTIKTHSNHTTGTGSTPSYTGLFSDDGQVSSVTRLAHLFKDDNIGSLFISPYRHWVILQLKTDDGVTDNPTTSKLEYVSRGYTGVLPVKGSDNSIYPSKKGSTHNESQFYSLDDDTATEAAGGRTVDNLYHNSWDLNINNPETSIAKLTTDYGFGAWDDEELVGGQAARTSIYKGWNYIDLKEVQNVEKLVQGDVLSLMLVPADLNKENDIGFYSSDYSTDTSLVPQLITRYVDELPNTPRNFKVAPSVDNSYNPEFSWTLEDKDIWYGLIVVDDSMIYNQYHGAVRWIPMNEGLETDACRSFDVSSGDQVGTGATATNNITDNLEGLAGHNKTFNGTNSYLKYGDGSSDATSDCTSLMSIVAHIIPNPSGSDVRRIISQMDSGGEKFDMWLDADNQVRAQVYYSDTEYVELNSTPILCDGETPTNVILTVDTTIREGNVRLYLNGKLSDISGRSLTTPISASYNNWKKKTNINSGNSSLYVGNHRTAATAFDGEMEEIVIYKKIVYPVTPQDNKLTFTKPLTDMTEALYSSSIGYVARLFIKDFHNIRGSASTDVCASSPITFRRASFVMDSREL